MKRIIEEGESIPKGYGVAYREFHRLGAVCYPIPIHIVIGLSRQLFYWCITFLFFWKTPKDQWCNFCYAKGRRQGRHSKILRFESEIAMLEARLEAAIDLQLRMQKG